MLVLHHDRVLPCNACWRVVRTLSPSMRRSQQLQHTCLSPLQDCEFTYLSVEILHLLGSEGPKTKDPAKYIRYIYNRIILENATVRAAAVSSLAKFGATVPELKERITTLLKRALHDNDDEVCVHLAIQFNQEVQLADCWMCVGA